MDWLRQFRASGGYQRWDRWLAWPLVVLGLLFLADLILPLAHPMTYAETTALRVGNIAIWLIFVVDYLARVYLALDRGRFIRTHVLDLIVIAVPFLRPFRLLRLFAIVASTSRRAGGLIVRRVTLYVVGVTVVVTTVGAVLVYDAERRAEGANIVTLGDSLWWAITTVVTVGYGDRYPVTPTGRAVAAVLMVTGVALIGTVTAAVAAWFVNAVRQASTAAGEADAATERADIQRQLAELQASVEALHQRLDHASPPAPAGSAIPGGH